MLKDVVSVIPCDPYLLKLKFEDGIEGIVALDELVKFEGVFASLREPAEFRKVQVHPELGVVCWPNGADLDSDVLYAKITGIPLNSRMAAIRD